VAGRGEAERIGDLGPEPPILPDRAALARLRAGTMSGPESSAAIPPSNVLVVGAADRVRWFQAQGKPAPGRSQRACGAPRWAPVAAACAFLPLGCGANPPRLALM